MDLFRGILRQPWPLSFEKPQHEMTLRGLHPRNGRRRPRRNVLLHRQGLQFLQGATIPDSIKPCGDKPYSVSIVSFLTTLAYILFHISCACTDGTLLDVWAFLCCLLRFVFPIFQILKNRNWQARLELGVNLAMKITALTVFRTAEWSGSLKFILTLVRYIHGQLSHNNSRRRAPTIIL